MQDKGTGRGPATRKFTRTRPSQAEHERRVAFGREWGMVGAQYKQRRLAREGR
jgi:hypothetical protein